MTLWFELTEEQKKLQEKCRQLAKEFAQVADKHDKDRLAPVENYRRLQEEGLTAFTIPKEMGGLGYNYIDYVIAMEELAQGCGATAMSFNMHVAGVAGIMENPFIDESFKREVADLVVNQKKLICQSASEPGSSSLIGQSLAPSLVAKKVDGGYILNGKKAFSTMFESADYVYLYAQPENSTSSDESMYFFLPTDAEGIVVRDVWHTLGMRATRSNLVEYHNVFVPDKYMVHHTHSWFEDFIMGNARWAFGTFAVVYYGIARGIVNWAKETLINRVPKGFSQSMGYHPAIRLRAGNMFADMESARLMVYNMAWVSETKGRGMETYAACLRAKYIVGKIVTKTINNVQIACGARSLMKNEPFERMLRDSLTVVNMPPSEDQAADLIGLLDLGLNPREAMPPLRGNN